MVLDSDPWAVTRWALGAGMLGGAALSDLRTRRVPNQYWFPFLAVALLFAARDVLVTSDRSALLMPYGAAAAVALFVYALWWLRLFGGADAKGLMVASLLAPVALAPPPLDRLPVLPPSLDALVNGCLLMMAVPFLLLAWNLAKGRALLPAALLGTSMPVARAKAAHVWPMQRIDAEGKLVWCYWQRAGTQDDAWAALEAAGVTDVWVTAKVPFMLPLLAGWLLSGLVGNVMLDLVARLV